MYTSIIYGSSTLLLECVGVKKTSNGLVHYNDFGDRTRMGFHIDITLNILNMQYRKINMFKVVRKEPD